MHFLAWWGMGNRFSIKINFNYFSLNDWQTVFCGESSASSVALLWPHNNSRFIHYAGKIKQRVDGVEPGTYTDPCLQVSLYMNGKRKSIWKNQAGDERRHHHHRHRHQCISIHIESYGNHSGHVLLFPVQHNRPPTKAQ